MSLIQHIDESLGYAHKVHFSLTSDGKKTCMCDCKHCCGMYKECLCKECDCKITNVHDPEGYTPQALRGVKIKRPCKDCGKEIIRRYQRGRWPIRCGDCRA
jgi:hypothetical protein